MTNQNQFDIRCIFINIDNILNNFIVWIYYKIIG
ncbi:hypothetical protein c7_L149 [Megavirus courdo7]|uniref:Uncharacterized protein n=1 Tax=Megavirus courdo7 TaxID=1128135 RepID=H2E9Z2_9VIRU|nr:hypothetical protein c7_L149 [Megavirus courdo7]